MKNREIKVRAWHKKQCKMIPSNLFKGTYNTIYENYELMQFTGLKDKNGKEIYEGDILLKEGNSEHTKKEYLNQKFIVEFDSTYASFWCRPLNPMPDNGVFMPHIYDCEVIGNIHESPELLNC